MKILINLLLVIIILSACKKEETNLTKKELEEYLDKHDMLFKERIQKLYEIGWYDGAAHTANFIEEYDKMNQEIADSLFKQDSTTLFERLKINSNTKIYERN